MGENSLLTANETSLKMDTNARSGADDVPRWVREYPLPEQLHTYLMQRRRALLLEVKEIEYILNLPQRRMMPSGDL